MLFHSLLLCILPFFHCLTLPDRNVINYFTPKKKSIRFFLIDEICWTLIHYHLGYANVICIVYIQLVVIWPEKFPDTKPIIDHYACKNEINFSENFASINWISFWNVNRNAKNVKIKHSRSISLCVVGFPFRFFFSLSVFFRLAKLLMKIFTALQNIFVIILLNE